MGNFLFCWSAAYDKLLSARVITPYKVKRHFCLNLNYSDIWLFWLNNETVIADYFSTDIV